MHVAGTSAAPMSRQYPVPPKIADSRHVTPPRSTSGSIGCAKAPSARGREGGIPVASSNTGDDASDRTTSNFDTPAPVVNEPTGLEPARNPSPATAWNLYAVPALTSSRARITVWPNSEIEDI